MRMVRGGADIVLQALNTGDRGWGQNRIDWEEHWISFLTKGVGALFSDIKGLFFMPH